MRGPCHNEELHQCYLSPHLFIKVLNKILFKKVFLKRNRFKGDRSWQFFSFSLSLLQVPGCFSSTFLFCSFSCSSPFLLFSVFLTSCKPLDPILTCRSFPARRVSSGAALTQLTRAEQWSVLRSYMQLLSPYTCIIKRHYRLKARSMNHNR